MSERFQRLDDEELALALALAWAEPRAYGGQGHPEDPLAFAYMMACGMVGHVDDALIPVADGSDAAAHLGAASDLAYRLRDTLGRVVLSKATT